VRRHPVLWLQSGRRRRQPCDCGAQNCWRSRRRSSLGLVRQVQLRLRRRHLRCRARSNLSLKAPRQRMRRLLMGCVAARWHPVWQRRAWLGPEAASDKAL